MTPSHSISELAAINLTFDDASSPAPNFSTVLIYAGAAEYHKIYSSEYNKGHLHLKNGVVQVLDRVLERDLR